MSKKVLKKGMLLIMLLTLCICCISCGKTEEAAIKYTDEVDTGKIAENLKNITSSLEEKEGVTVTNTSEDGLMVTAVYKDINKNTLENSSDTSEDIITTYTGTTIPVGSLENNREYKKMKIDKKEYYYQISEDENHIFFLQDVGEYTYLATNITRNNKNISVKETCEKFIL